jgi:hypothetical protein
MELTALGHKNVLATHKTTLEFTKDDYLTKKGDCILAINLDKIPKAMQGKIKIILKRTYATRANKASKDINKNIIKLLKNPKNKLKIQLASL